MIVLLSDDINIIKLNKMNTQVRLVLNITIHITNSLTVFKVDRVNFIFHLWVIFIIKILYI